MDFSILKTLTQLAGISGREEAVRAFLQQQLAGCAGQTRVDALGNLIFYKKGKNPQKLLLCAHMDEVGLMVNYVGPDGFLRFITVGGIDPRTLLAQRVAVHTAGGQVLPGVIGTKPAHVTTEADRGKAVPAGDLFIDVGLSGEEAAKLISPGDFAVLERDWLEFGTDFISAKAFDDRVGCFVLLEALKAVKEPICDVYAVFTTQEEVGLRGAGTAAFGIEADWGLAVDSTGAADIPGCRPQDYLVSLGKGVGVTALDARTITNPKLFEALKALCVRENIAYQVRIAPRGGNDAGALHQSKTGMPACSLSVPTRNIHSNVETVCKRDIAATLALLSAVLEKGLQTDLQLQ